MMNVPIAEAVRTTGLSESRLGNHLRGKDSKPSRSSYVRGGSRQCLLGRLLHVAPALTGPGAHHYDYRAMARVREDSRGTTGRKYGLDTQGRG